MERRHETFVDVTDGYRLWVETTGDADVPALLLVMGANASGVGWPDELVQRLSEQHLVVRYDHRDTGRSTHAFDERPYPLRVLAADAIAVLDALDIDRAHVVGMSMGGTLTQVLLVDHPDRFLSATIFGTPALDDLEAPGPDPQLLELWGELGQERDADAERAWQVRHWRILNGGVLPFDEDEFEQLDRRITEHRGTPAAATAHAQADPEGLERDTGAITVPVLVIDAPEDPVAPPPTAQRLAAAVPTARLVSVPGLGHALPRVVIEPLATAILEHTR